MPGILLIGSIILAQSLMDLVVLVGQRVGSFLSMVRQLLVWVLARVLARVLVLLYHLDQAKA